jgi:hypothetical protein
VILRCLEKEAARRSQSAEELEQALAGCACAGGWTPPGGADSWRQRVDKGNDAAR